MNPQQIRRVMLSWLVLLLLSTGAPLAVPQAIAQTIARGPYLQLGTATSMVLRWRTSTATNSRVQYGDSPTNLTGVENQSAATTNHEVTITGLTPSTRYYYSVGTSTGVLAGGDANHFFVTSPAAGTAQPTRIWVIGDSGTANASAQAVRNAYLNFTGTRHTDLWLMLGDNAYESGTDAEYQSAVFNMYPTLLRQSVVWPTLGNHDGQTANSALETGPYYDIFTLPRNAEAGGVASGTEAYYSFDHGNIHFVVLDSFETSRASNGAMLTWLRNDLTFTRQPWIVAFWHHPPYSKGSHDSDSETELIQMRQNALPILEAAGVDLVLSGHSHSYERSFLLDGHYGSSSTLSPSMIRNGGSGRADGSGAYQKSALDSVPNEGAVYAVAGSSGQTSGGSLNHPAMFISLNSLGSMVLDVNGDRLDARFINQAGSTQDYFTIIKGGAPQLPSVNIAAMDSTATEAGATTGTFTVTRTGATTAALTALYGVSGTATSGSDYTALSGSVTIPAGAASATITVTPINDTSVESNETVIATLSASANYTTGTPASATITITSDDVNPSLPVVSIRASDATATEAGRTAGTFTVTRTGATTAALTALYGVSGTATSGSDYTALSGSVTIPAGAASATIRVRPTNDTLVESNETVIATLSSSTNYTVGTPASATITITSNDVNRTVVSIRASDTSATEAGPTTGTFTVTRTGATTSALTVLYSRSGTATPGSDYTALSGTVTIPAGAASATITVAPINDTLIENNETVVASLSASASYTIGTPASATITISSDDSSVPPGTQVSLIASDVFDNKNAKTYRAGGPDGADPLNDLRSLAEEYKFEIESGSTYWWEARYQDPQAGSPAPSRMLVTIEYRSESEWQGTLRAEYRHNGGALATINLPVDSGQDPVTGKGQKGRIVWDLSSTVDTAQELAGGALRFINASTNGKKLWITHSVSAATLGAP